MKTRLILLVAAGLVLHDPVAAQSLVPVQFNFREYCIESVASQRGEPGDYEAILNELEDLQKKPLDLNKARDEDLRRLPFLTDFQVQSLLDYRRENGNLLSLNELSLVYGFTDELIGLMLPYVTLRNDADTAVFRFREAVRKSNHEVMMRTQRVLEKSKGYISDNPVTGQKHYPGNPWLYYLRYGLDFNDHLQAGLTLGKDPGEEFFTGSNRGGFDFNSAYIMVTDKGTLKSALIGDFRLGFGQGLTLCNGTAPGKSALPLNVVRRNDGIKAFTSNDENDFFRGVATSVEWGRLIITGFYSVNRKDANITDTLPSGGIYFSSFQGSGYHRTNAETSDENTVTETAWGGNLSFRGNNFKVGSTLVKYQFDKSLEAGEDPKDIYDFSGSNLFNWGADYSLSLKKVQFFGETTYGNHHWATLNGALLNINKYASFSLVYRNYSKAFFSLHSDAFSEGSSNTNEEAVYTGLVIHPFRKMKISAYADFYRFPWLQYGLGTPSSGSDYLLQADYSVSRKLEMYFRVRYELDPEDESGDTLIIRDLFHWHRTGFRYHVSYRLTDRLSLQNRLEMIQVRAEEDETSRGFLIYQDAEYRFKSIPLVLDFRFAWFNTDNYTSRIYAYELDLTSGFSFSPLYNKGYRTYLMLRYDITSKLLFRFRIARTCFFHENSMGSGYDEIKGNCRSEIKMQLIVRL
jgi:hypothetical protein